MGNRRKERKRPRIISRVLWIINIPVAIFLLASYLSSYVDPAITTLFAFLGLAYPILLLINILFVVYWLIRLRRRLLLSLVILAAGFQPMTRHVQLLPGNKSPEEKGITVLSYNVQNMAHSNDGMEKQAVRNAIHEFIAAEGADITCLQEYSGWDNSSIGVLERLKEKTGYRYVYHADYYAESSRRVFALVTLSQFPAVGTHALSLPEDNHNFGFYTDLVVHDDTFRVYNLHLESIRLQQSDYRFVEEISRGQTGQGTIKESSRSIISKLHHAYIKRSRQSTLVVSSLATSPYPVIVCGDFNDTPLSYAYHKISKSLDDAFIQSGRGLGNTFSGKLPPLRIDFILTSPVFLSHDFTIHRLRQSDHYPISTSLTLRNN